MSQQKPVNCTMWIAVSFYGNPAPYLGYAFTRKQLKANYATKFGRADDLQALDRAGYRAVKVQMREI